MINDMIDRAIAAVNEWSGGRALTTAMNAVPTVEVYLAGGAVRDTLAHRPMPKDFDFFIGGPGCDVFLRRLGEYGDLAFGPFGSPRWTPAAGRRYADVIPIACFNNGLEPCATIDDALRQFDFTANAVAIDLRRRKFHNPCAGAEDLACGVMRAVRYDYPDEPIAPGLALSRIAVLWLRLMHYSHCLGLTPDAATAAWLRRHQHHVSERERFADLFFTPQFGTNAVADQ